MNHASNQGINKSSLLTGSFLPGMLFSLMLLSLMAILLLWSAYYQHPLYSYGVFPRSLHGLKGILFSPLIHQDWQHLGANAWSFCLLSTILSVYFPKDCWKTGIWLYVLTGFYTWCLGREASHIGASGLNYALVSFFFFFGVFRWHRRYLAISLLMVFLYGSMVWGIFPIDPLMSWEAHFSGGLAGAIVAFLLRNTEKELDKEYEWQEEESEQPDDTAPEVGQPESQQAHKIVYHYKPNKGDGET